MDTHMTHVYYTLYISLGRLKNISGSKCQMNISCTTMFIFCILFNCKAIFSHGLNFLMESFTFAEDTDFQVSFGKLLYIKFRKIIKSWLSVVDLQKTKKSM